MAEQLLVNATFAVRLDIERLVKSDAVAGERVGEILTRAPFAAFEHVGGRGIRSKSKLVATTAATILENIRDARFDTIAFESSGADLVAGGWLRTAMHGPAPNTCGVARPVAGDTDDFLAGIGELAAILQTHAGFVAIEPSFLRAYKLASGASIPDARDALSDERRRGRRARDKHSDQLATSLATVEWGTLLGPGHLARVDLDQLRTSGAFERVVQVSPSLAYLQVTANPLDDLTGELERHLPRAREVLQPLLMDLSGVTLE